jgi:hypothetical protein
MVLFLEQNLKKKQAEGRIVNRPFGPGPGSRCDRDAAYTDSPGFT